MNFPFEKLLIHVGHAIEVVTRGDSVHVGTVQIVCETCDKVLVTESKKQAENETPITVVYTSEDRKQSFDLDISAWAMTQSDAQLQMLRSRFKKQIVIMKLMLLDYFCDLGHEGAIAFRLYTEVSNQDMLVRAEISDLYAWVETHRAYLMTTA